MNKLFLVILCLIIFYLLFFRKQHFEKMTNTDLNSIFNIKDNKYYAKQKYSNKNILKCKDGDVNICKNLIFTNDGTHNADIINMEGYPLIPNRRINEGEEVKIKSPDFQMV